MKRLLQISCSIIVLSVLIHAQTFTIDNTQPTGGSNYQTFGAAVTALNALTLTQPVVFNVSAGQVFTEDVAAITKSGTAANTITFQKSGSGSNPVIKPTGGSGTSDAGITLNGADYITFNGIDITIAAGSAVEYGFFLKNSSATDGAQYNTIKNTKITLNSANVLSNGVYQYVATIPTSAGGANSNNTFDNVTINNSYFGLSIIGNSAYPDSGIIIKNSTIGAATVDDIGGTSTTGGGNWGMKLSDLKNVEVSFCEIQNVTYPRSGSNNFVYGVWLNGLQGTNGFFSNKIHDVTSKRISTGSPIYGVVVNSTAGSTIDIYNNMVFKINPISGASSSTVALFGLQVTGAGNSNVYFNSVHLTGTMTYGAAALYLNCTGTTVNVQNNILRERLTNSGSNKNFCIYKVAGSTLSTCNYNNYDCSATSPHYTGYDGAANQLTLTNWKTSVGKDVNSKQFSTDFISATDLHLNLSSVNHNYDGTPITSPAITTDIDGQSRDPNIPYIGADENTTYPLGTVSVPTLQATNIAFANVATTSMTSNWTRGNGGSVAVFMKEGSQGTITNPTDGSTYTASADWSAKGTQLGSSGYYCVYNGSAATVNLTNLSQSTTYWLQAFEYSGSGAGTLYLTTSAANNPNSQTTASPAAPTVTTSSITNITGTTASGGGNVTADGGAAVTVRGVCWNTTGSPSISDPHTSDGSGTGTFTSAITGLSASTTYYVRAYATNSVGTSYGLEVSFSSIGAFYNLPNSDVTVLSNWGTETNGTGNHPANFTSDGVSYNLFNTGPTMSSPWTVSGSNSKIILGDGTNAVSFTIPASSLLAGTVDVSNNSTLTIQNTTNPTLGTLNSGSTVVFDGTGALTIPAANYGNLSSTNDAGVSRTLASAGTIGIAGTFSPGSGIYVNTGSTVTFNGTSTQTLPSFRFRIVNIHNSCVIPSSKTVSVDSAMTITAGDTLTVSGTLVNYADGATVFTVNGAIVVTSTGLYTIASDPTTGSVQIPTATWQAGSICRIYGIIGVAGTDYNNLYGVNQTFSNFEINSPNLIGKLVITNRSAGNFAVNGQLTINNTGTGSGIQLTKSGVQTTINLGSYRQLAGIVHIVHNTSTAATRNINVAGNFILSDTAAFNLVNATGGGSTVICNLNVGGNLSLLGSSKITKDGTTNGVGNLVFNGAGDQTATLNPFTGTVNVTLNKPSGVLYLGKDANINGTFTLTRGRVNIQTNNLTFESTATLAGSVTDSSMVIASGSGEVRRLFAAAGSFTFPVGDSIGVIESSPITVTFNSGSFSSGVVGVKVKNSKHPNNSSATSYLNRYWQLSSSGITGFNAEIKARYQQADVNGTESDIYTGRYSAGTWTAFSPANISGDSLSAAGLSALGDFTGGEGAAFGGVNGIITMKFIPEGYFDTDMNRLNIRDTFKIYLANITTPYAVVDSAKCLIDSVTFTGTATFTNAANATYYLVVIGRNSIESWSKSGGEIFTKGAPMSYDFTTAATQTYGSNAVQKSSKWCLYSGDVNRDGIVDFSDLLLIDNDSFNFTSGYVDTDITGDLFVDFTDLLVCDNNSFNFIGVVKPGGAARPAKTLIRAHTGE